MCARLPVHVPGNCPPSVFDLVEQVTEQLLADSGMKLMGQDHPEFACATPRQRGLAERQPGQTLGEWGRKARPNEQRCGALIGSEHCEMPSGHESSDGPIWHRSREFFRWISV